jgi:hypothetical protein
MQLLAIQVKWYILAQLALLGVYIWQTDLLTALYIRYCYSGADFLLCIAGTVAIGWSDWTGLRAVCGFRCLGRKVS